MSLLSRITSYVETLLDTQIVPTYLSDTPATQYLDFVSTVSTDNIFDLDDNPRLNLPKVYKHELELIEFLKRFLEESFVFKLHDGPRLVTQFIDPVLIMLEDLYDEAYSQATVTDPYYSKPAFCLLGLCNILRSLTDKIADYFDLDVDEILDILDNFMSNGSNYFIEPYIFRHLLSLLSLYEQQLASPEEKELYRSNRTYPIFAYIIFDFLNGPLVDFESSWFAKALERYTYAVIGATVKYVLNLYDESESWDDYVRKLGLEPSKVEACNYEDLDSIVRFIKQHVLTAEKIDNYIQGFFKDLHSSQDLPDLDLIPNRLKDCLYYAINVSGKKLELTLYDEEFYSRLYLYDILLTHVSLQAMYDYVVNLLDRDFEFSQTVSSYLLQTINDCIQDTVSTWLSSRKQKEQ